MAQHCVPHPVQETFPVFAPEKDKRKRMDLVGLHEGEGFKELIQGAESSGHTDVTHGVLYEHHLPCEKVTEAKRLVLVYVRLLFHRQFYIKPNGLYLIICRSPVCRFHSPRAPACDYRVAVLGQ